MEDGDLHDFPPVTSCCIPDEIHGFTAIFFRDEDIRGLPEDILRYPSGEPLEGMVETGDTELPVPDNDRGIGIVDQVFEILARLAQFISSLDLPGHIIGDFPGTDHRSFTIADRRMDDIECLGFPAGVFKRNCLFDTFSTKDFLPLLHGVFLLTGHMRKKVNHAHAGGEFLPRKLLYLVGIGLVEVCITEFRILRGYHDAGTLGNGIKELLGTAQLHLALPEAFFRLFAAGNFYAGTGNEIPADRVLGGDVTPVAKMRIIGKWFS